MIFIFSLMCVAFTCSQRTPCAAASFFAKDKTFPLPEDISHGSLIAGFPIPGCNLSVSDAPAPGNHL